MLASSAPATASAAYAQYFFTMLEARRSDDADLSRAAGAALEQALAEPEVEAR